MLVRTLAFVAVLAAGALVAVGAASAQQPLHKEEPFYKGKRVTLLVNFAAGGPTDVEGRLFARSIAHHIAGQPAILVRNIEGAGGMTGANYLGEIAARDGTTIGYFSSVAWLYAVLPGERRIAFDTYDFVAINPGRRSTTCAPT